MDGTGYGADRAPPQKTLPSEPLPFADTDNTEPGNWRQDLELSVVEARLLQRFGVSRRVLQNAKQRAQVFGLDVVSVLIANGVLDGPAWWTALARALGVNVRMALQPALTAPAFRKGRLAVPDPRVALVLEDADAVWPVQAIAPRGPAVDALAALLKRHPSLAARIVVAPPQVIADSVRQAASGAAARQAIDGLMTQAPHMSARTAPGWGQLACLAALALVAIVLMWAWPPVFVLAMAVPTCVAFLAVSLVRIAAGLLAPRRRPAVLRHGRAPRYLVLVPLVDEAAVVGDLIRALSRLRYPRERLTIVLVLEAHDEATRAAVAARPLPSWFATVVVPQGGPRTKPHALAYALSLFAGELVTVYDAEDRPHPDQLIEAAQAFATGSPRLACLQSPLVIDTVGHGSTWISRQFALEYDALFRRVLPVLAACKVPFPLGGTSMHLKRAVLDAVGGWDPCNVTEDADLGMRLARFGYKSGCLALPTYEEAPLCARTWVGQRSRWLKGWMQTWFVHMRAPVQLWREARPMGFLALNLFVLGSIVSAIAYPISLAVLILGFFGVVPIFADRTLWGDIWLVSFLVAFAAGVGASVWLTSVSIARTGAAKWRELALTPLYWLLAVFAFGVALIDFIRSPFGWRKTAHGRAPRRPVPDGGARPRSAARRPPRPPLRANGSPR